MPNRIIKETIKTSAQIDSLSWFEEVVYYRLLVTADDYGCMDGRIVLLKNELFPTKDNVTKSAVENAISKLVSVGLLCQYTVSGMPYLFFPTWEKHQRVRNKHRKYPEPTEINCNTFDSDSRSNDRQMTAACRSESESNPNPNSNQNPNQNPNTNTPSASRARFIPPTVEDVREYCLERCNNVDAQHFVDHYTSNGWKVGKNPMKDWKATVRTWERNGYEKGKQGHSDPVASRLKSQYEMMARWAEEDE